MRKREANFDLLRIVSFGDLDSQSCGTLYINYTKKGDFVILNKEKNFERHKDLFFLW